jgi:AraC-like DNA-binding protein
MITFTVNHNHYGALLRDLASLLQLPLKAVSRLAFEQPVGKGYMQPAHLFEGLEILFADAILTNGLITYRPKSDNRIFILHFDDVFIAKTASFEVDDNRVQKTNTIHSVARLTSNCFSNKEIIPAGQHVKSIKILMSEAWLKKYLELDAESDVLKKYLQMKAEGFDMENLDTEYKKLLNDLWKEAESGFANQLVIQNRIMLLIELFFSRILKKLSVIKTRCNLNKEELERLLQVEEKIVNNLAVPPPTIDECARMASMSTTKLKICFKETFGSSIYSYYQKHRLEKARQLLLGKTMNVRQAAHAIGYDSTSNFITAFKKQFDLLPGSLTDN